MMEQLTKTRFVNALVREHVQIHQLRQSRSLDTSQGYLSIELTSKSHDMHDTQECRLIIRGNRIGMHWMVFDTGLPYTFLGVRKAHHLASDVALAAVTKISDEIGEPANIELPKATFFRPWFAEQE